METFQIRSRLIAEAESPEPGLIVSVYEQAPKEAKSSVIAAQTADTMVAISGIYVSSLSWNMLTVRWASVPAATVRQRTDHYGRAGRRRSSDCGRRTA